MFDFYRPWSLWDMLKLPIAQLLGSFMHITDFGRTMHDASIDGAGKSGTFPRAYFVDLTSHIENFCVACDEIGLMVTLNCARDFQRKVEGIRQPDGSGVIPSADIALFASYASMIAGCLPHEADTKYALAVPLDKVKFLDPTAPPFGIEVNNSFPDAVQDIEDAGRCLALGQGTATVMHLMRVMEIGLKAIALGLKIPYAPSWESYLTQIAKKITEKHANKPASWKRQEEFYRDISGDLISIKQAWRNPTMHVGRKYYPDEAQVIFDAIKTLMQRLVTKQSIKKRETSPRQLDR